MIGITTPRTHALIRQYIQNRYTRFLIIGAQKMLDQRPNVTVPVSQRWQSKTNHLDPVEQVLVKCSCLNFSL